DPQTVLPLVDEFFGGSLGRTRMAEVAAGPLFRRDAKRPGQAFDVRARDHEREQLRAYLGADLPAVLRPMEEAFPRPPRLAQPLAVPAPKRSRFNDTGVAAPAA